MKHSLCVALLLFAFSVALDAQQLYASNELGMQLEKISEAQRSGHQWVLSVQSDGQDSTRILYDNGKAVKRWVDVLENDRLAEERVYIGSVLSEKTRYRNGLPERIDEYSDGSLSRITTLRYSDGLLVSDEVRSADGTLEYSDHYEHGLDGRLRRFTRSYPDGSRTVSSLTYASGSLATEWLGSGGTGTLYRYSGSHLVSKEQWNGGDLVSREEVTHSSAGSRSVDTNVQSGLETTKSYDAKGRIVSEVEQENGNVTRTVDYRYADGLLVARTTRSPGVREEKRYEYDSKGKLTRTETTRNRMLVQKTYYTGEGSYYEELYAGGRAVIRVYYHDGHKTKEEALAQHQRSDAGAYAPTPQGGGPPNGISQ